MASTVAKVTRLPGNTTITVTVVITRRLRFRLWVAKQCIWLAGWVLQVPIEVTFEVEE